MFNYIHFPSCWNQCIHLIRRYWLHKIYILKKKLTWKWENGPGWCGSVDWALACEPKGLEFDSQSGHMPGFQARPPVGGMWEATNQREANNQCISHTWMFFSLSFSLPSPLSKNKWNIKKKRRKWENVLLTLEKYYNECHGNSWESGGENINNVLWMKKEDTS